MNFTRPVFSFVLVSGLVIARAEVAHADETALARSLFDAGLAAIKSGQITPEVCAKFAESNRLDPALGTRFYYAECLEKIGRTASAWATYLDVAEAAGTAKLRDHERYSRDRAAALSVRLTRMIVVVPADVRAIPGLQISRDGQLVREPTFGTAVPVDPGRHQVSVNAPGRRTWTSEVEASGEGSTVTVTVPSLQTEPEMKAGPTGPIAGVKEGATSGGYWGPQRIVAVNAVGLGALGLALGIGLGLDAGAKLKDTEPYCLRGSGNAPDQCSIEAKPLMDAGRSAAAGSTVAFVAGSALLVGGVVLWLTSPSGKEGGKPGENASETTLAKGMWVSPQVGGLTVGGTF